MGLVKLWDCILRAWEKGMKKPDYSSCIVFKGVSRGLNEFK